MTPFPNKGHLNAKPLGADSLLIHWALFALSPDSLLILLTSPSFPIFSIDWLNFDPCLLVAPSCLSSKPVAIAPPSVNGAHGLLGESCRDQHPRTLWVYLLGMKRNKSGCEHYPSHPSIGAVFLVRTRISRIAQRIAETMWNSLMKWAKCAHSNWEHKQRYSYWQKFYLQNKVEHVDLSHQHGVSKRLASG